MPIYEFECEKTGEVKEIILPLEDYNIQFINCPIHCRPFVEEVNGKVKTNTILEYPLHAAEKIFSIPANINIGKPTIIFKNPLTGDVEIAVSDHDTPPHGYIKEELHNPIERSKFEKEYQTRQNVRDELVTEKLKQDHAQTRKNRHADIEAKMGDIPNDGTREFLRKAMARKSKRKFPEKRTDVKLTVNHTDSSNLIK